MVAVGAEEGTDAADRTEVDTLVTRFNDLLADYDQFVSADPLATTPVREVALGDESLFRLFIGKRVLRKDVSTDDSLIPVYSANVFQPMGYIGKSNIAEFTHPAILWGVDGNFEFNFLPAGRRFATTDHCGTIQILTSSIVPEHILYALNRRRIEESFNRAFRASLSNMRTFLIKIPIGQDGNFDVHAQKEIAKRFTTARDKRSGLEHIKRQLDVTFQRYIGSVHL